MSERPFSISKNDVCESTEQLVASPKFARFVAYHNGKSGDNLTVDQVKNSYDAARRLFETWESSIVSGRINDVREVGDLVEDSLLCLQHNDIERMLGEEEIIERFDRIGYDLLRIRSSNAEFYKKNGFGKLFPGGYSLPLPEINEADMGNFELACSRNEIDTLFIDDGRFDDQTTLQLIYPEMPELPKLIELAANHDVAFKGLKRNNADKVKLTGHCVFKKREIRNGHYDEVDGSFFDMFKKSSLVDRPYELGTFCRFTSYLAGNPDHLLFTSFTSRRGLFGDPDYSVDVALNAFSGKGGTVLSAQCPDRKNILLKAVDPMERRHAREMKLVLASGNCREW